MAEMTRPPTQRRRLPTSRLRTAATSGVLLVVLISLGLVVLPPGTMITGAAAKSTTTTTTTKPTTTSTANTTSSVAVNDFAAIPQVVQKLQPSVVTIETSQGLGSGVVWSSGGLVVTDAHVVGTNTTVQVDFADGKQVSGSVKATDDVSDLAVVQADRTGVTPAQFVTTLPTLGDLAVVIGSPLGFTNSVTAGVISGEGREIPGSASQSQSLVNLVQTDAAVSPGNSGGALANGAAGVTGIVEAYIPPTAGAVSLGFAIPSATVVDIVKQLIATGKATHAYLGVASTAITPDIQKQLGLSTSKGVALQQVAANSPAANAGLQPGDVIISIDGQTIATPEDLLTVLHKHQPGDKINITYVRDGQQQTTTATLTDRPSQ